MTIKLSAKELARAVGGIEANAVRFVTPMNEAMDEFGIDTPLRVGAFLATVGIETAGLSKIEEDLYYKSAARLVTIYPRAFKTEAQAEPFARNPQALSKKLYDGFHGRGCIQLTGRENYQRAANDLHFPYVQDPALVCEPVHACLTAAWFWNRANCNSGADQRDMEIVTRKVNGPAKLHLVERTALFNQTMEWMA